MDPNNMKQFERDEDEARKHNRHAAESNRQRFSEAVAEKEDDQKPELEVSEVAAWVGHWRYGKE